MNGVRIYLILNDLHLLLGALVVDKVIGELTERIGEHLEDDDDKQRHNDPLHHLEEESLFDDPAEAETENEHNDRNNDCGPNHKALAESLDVHNDIV